MKSNLVGDVLGVAPELRKRSDFSNEEISRVALSLDEPESLRAQ